jgi:hypothetical protein
MKKNKALLLLTAIAVVASAFYGSHEYFKPNPDMSVLIPAFRSDAPGLLKEFSTDDSAATRKYLGKVVLTNGTIRDIEKSGTDYYTLVLGNPGDPSSVRCAIDTHHTQDLARLRAGAFAEVKGIFTGYNKDVTGLLGSDAQLNRCVVINKN